MTQHTLAALASGVAQIIVETWNSGKPTPEFNNAGQIFNHDFYWESMAPNAGGARRLLAAVYKLG